MSGSYIFNYSSFLIALLAPYNKNKVIVGGHFNDWGCKNQVPLSESQALVRRQMLLSFFELLFYSLSKVLTTTK